jgi:hypothetical protein
MFLVYSFYLGVIGTVAHLCSLMLFVKLITTSTIRRFCDRSRFLVLGKPRLVWQTNDFSPMSFPLENGLGLTRSSDVHLAEIGHSPRSSCCQMRTNSCHGSGSCGTAVYSMSSAHRDDPRLPELFFFFTEVAPFRQREHHVSPLKLRNPSAGARGAWNLWCGVPATNTDSTACISRQIQKLHRSLTNKYRHHAWHPKLDQVLHFIRHIRYSLFRLNAL